MKLKTLLVLMLTVSVLWSCKDKDKDDEVNPLVGTWKKEFVKEEMKFLGGVLGMSASHFTNLSDKTNISFQFKDDKTGVAVIPMGINMDLEFSWVTVSKTLTITFKGSMVDGKKIVSEYSISGSELTLKVGDKSMKFTKE